MSNKMADLMIRNPSILLKRASRAWRFLNGTINVYKPAEMETRTVIKAIKTNICAGKFNSELNSFNNNSNLNFNTFSRFK